MNSHSLPSGKANKPSDGACWFGAYREQVSSVREKTDKPILVPSKEEIEWCVAFDMGIKEGERRAMDKIKEATDKLIHELSIRQNEFDFGGEYDVVCLSHSRELDVVIEMIEIMQRELGLGEESSDNNSYQN